MSLLRFLRVERRSSATDALVAALTARAAGGSVASPGAVGALEAAAGTVGRAFMGATVEGPEPYARALTPGVLSMIGRELIRRGEAAFLIGVRGDRIRLTPAASWNITGGEDPERWMYEIHLSGPSGSTARKRVPAASVLHFRYAVDPARPWAGLGPLQVADAAGRLAAETDVALADESSGPRANLVPVPVDGQDPTVTALRKDIAGAKGKALLVESTAKGWADGGGMNEAKRADWRAERLGANPPPALVNLHTAAARSVLGACGVPVELVEPGDGTGQREAWRRLLFGTVAPIARDAEAELRDKLDPGLSLAFAELRASDLAGRARAYQSLTGAGMDPAEARTVCGF